MVTGEAASGSVEFTKYSTEFLNAGVGARAEGLGNAFASIVNDATAIYWNPAGLSDLRHVQVHGTHAERFAGAVNVDFLGIGVPFGMRSALGVGLVRLGVDDIPITRKTDPSRPLIYVDDRGQTVVNPPIVEKMVDDQEMAFLLTVSFRRSDRVAVGVNMKTIYKSIGDFSAWGLGFDVGILVQPSPSLRLGMVLKDATSTLVAWRDGRTEAVPPRLRIGAAWSKSWRKWTVLPAIDFESGFNRMGKASQLHAGMLDVNTYGGVEIGYHDRIFLRVGDSRGRLTVGTGFQISAFLIDYSFTRHSDLGNSHRVSVGFALDKNRLSSF
jgi:hypothetical protein